MTFTLGFGTIIVWYMAYGPPIIIGSLAPAQLIDVDRPVIVIGGTEITNFDLLNIMTVFSFILAAIYVVEFMVFSRRRGH